MVEYESIPGRAVQVGPMKPAMKAPATKMLDTKM